MLLTVFLVLFLGLAPAARAEKSPSLTLAGGGVLANTLLTSGVPAPFSLPAVSSSTLFAGDSGFRITVPTGATRLEVRIFIATPSADVDLYVRYASDVIISGGDAVADYRSEGDTGNEIIAVRPSATAPLREGVYYIALGLFTTATAVTGAVTATVDTGPTLPTGTLLSSGTPRTFSFSPVTGATLFNGHYSYGITVPAGSSRMEVRLVTATSGADLDLFVRLNTDPVVSGGSIVADHRSTGPAGAETVTITPSSTPALQAGTYYIALGLFTTGIPVTGTLTVTLTGAPRLETSPATALDFGSVAVGQSKDLAATLRNTGTAPLDVTAVTSSSPLFSAVSPAAPFSVAAGAQQAVMVRYRPSSAGAITATLTIASNDLARPSATLSLVGLGQAPSNPPPPGVSLSPSALDFTAAAGSNPGPQLFQVASTGAGTLTYRVTKNQPWLSVSPAQGVGSPAAITVSISTAGLAPQSYTGEIRVSSVVTAADPRAPSQTVLAVVPVTLNLTAPPNPVISLSRAALFFSAAAENDPAPQAFQVRNLGGGTLNFSVSTNQPWLTVSPDTGVSTGDPVTIIVSAAAAGLAPLTYNAEIRVLETASPEGSKPGQEALLTVKFLLTGRNTSGAPGSGPQSLGSDAPLITLNGIVNAASFASPLQPGGSIALGSVFSLFGERLGPKTLASVASFPLPRTLSGVTVTVSRGATSVEAIPLAVVVGQINAILPSNAPLGDVLVTVRYNGRTSPPVTARTAPTAFGVFTLNSSGRGPGLIQNYLSPAEQPVNSASTPASPGQVVTLWGTGLGAINAPDHLPPPAGTLPVGVDIFIGDRPVTEILYAGRAPCCAGIDQIVFRIPSDAPSGCAVPVQVRASTLPANLVTIAISPCQP